MTFVLRFNNRTQKTWDQVSSIAAFRWARDDVVWEESHPHTKRKNPNRYQIAMPYTSSLGVVTKDRWIVVKSNLRNHFRGTGTAVLSWAHWDMIRLHKKGVLTDAVLDEAFAYYKGLLAGPVQEPVLEPMLVEEPVFQLVQEPVVEQEPVPVVEQEPVPVVVQEPVPVVVQEPVPVVVQEPVPVVVQEPVLVQEPVQEPVPAQEPVPVPVHDAKGSILALIDALKKLRTAEVNRIDKEIESLKKQYTALCPVRFSIGLSKVWDHQSLIAAYRIAKDRVQAKLKGRPFPKCPYPISYPLPTKNGTISYDSFTQMIQNFRRLILKKPNTASLSAIALFELKPSNAALDEAYAFYS